MFVKRNRNRVRKLVTVVLLFFTLGQLFAQDSQLSQFYSSPLYLAPSFAGATDGDRIAMNYRNQWPALPKSFVTYVFSYGHYFPRMNSGLGVLVTREQAGTSQLATTNAGLLYSYNIIINSKWSVRPGLSFLYTERSLNFDKLIFGDELISDDTGGSVAVPTLDRKADIDAAASVLAYNEKYWVGLTVDHILQPDRSLTGSESLVPMKFTLFGGAKIPILRRYNKPSGQSLSPAFLYKQQGVNSQLDMGLYWYQMPLALGVWYRGIPVFKNQVSNDAIAFLVGYRLKNFTIGYSYDFTISQLVGNTGGTHELSINILFNQGVTEREKRRQIPCPDI